MLAIREGSATEQKDYTRFVQRLHIFVVQELTVISSI